MEFNLPTFGEDTDAMIARLEQETGNFFGEKRQLQLSYEEEAAKIREKWSKKLRELDELNKARLDELARLKEKAKKEAEAKIYERTAQIVREIVKDFENWSKLHVYQVEDVISIVHAYLNGERGMLNANEMGLGKTLETIVANYIITALFEREFARKPHILWLTKASILETNSTKNEIARWHPELKVIPISGSEKKEMREFLVKLAYDGHWPIITNYETVRTTDNMKNLKWDIIIMDEVHKLKGGVNANGPTQIWEAVRDISRDSKFMQILSGTPIVNKAEEMWSYLHIFDPVTFNDPNKFRNQFSSLRSVAGELKVVVDTEKLLRLALKGRMIRRTAVEVGQELPELTQIDQIGKHNPQQAAAYQQMRERFFVWLDETKAPLTANAIIAQLTRLRQINVWPVFDFKITNPETGEEVKHRLDVPDSWKIDEAMDIIFLAQDQVVIGSNFNTPMEEIKRRCTENGQRCEIIDSTYKDKMGEYEADFQQGKIDVLCINLAMGEGLNLQKNPEMWPGGAAVGITLDRWWNSARNEQFMKRIHRQGATIPCFFYHLYVERSVDYFIKAIIEEKDMELKAIMDSKVVRPASEWKKYLGDLI